MNKYKYLGFLTGLAACLAIFGEWARITHQSYADKVFTAGMWMLAICVGIYVYVKVSGLGNKK
jgi:hypothetical protein